MLTVLVDYDSGNLHSAEKAFQRMAAEVGGGEILVTSWVEAGAGEIELGYCARESRSSYFGFPANLQAPLNLRYQPENGSIRSATNLLQRGIRANEEIRIVVTDAGVSATAVDGAR